MAGSTTKKVLVRRFDREPLTGFVNPQSYLLPGGVELLRTDGTVSLVPYREIKTVSFVKDFEAAEAQPERLVFHTRPKMDGLWVRMRFRDGEVMDGILSNNLLQLEPYGFTFTPPEPYANNQRVFSPREALSEFHVLGVVGSPLTRRRRKEVPKEQIGLFEPPE
ncbi:MAG TPA: hypothetical protein VLX58_00965 [Bryobacteraceae bacterium]|nr:hypothetical protein [Bryobacteraceae bacterium]HUJ20052.1 hypothetical protein [Bryobacteraceae bacterium]